MSDQQRRAAGSAGTAQTIGVATAVAIVAGIAAWVIAEFALDEPRSDAISLAASAAGLVLMIGVIIAVYRALASDRSR